MSLTEMREKAPTRTRLDQLFTISDRGATLGREIRGGVVTFFTMATSWCSTRILSGVIDGSGTFIGGRPTSPRHTARGRGHRRGAGVISILMGLVANFPIALAAGLGINGLITGMVVTHSAEKLTYADLMGLVGVIILVLVLAGFRRAVFKAIPGRSRSLSRSAARPRARSSSSTHQGTPGDAAYLIPLPRNVARAVDRML